MTVRTRAFKEWFGDWENDAKNASKVVDGNGEPLVVYHGTDADFTVFDRAKTRAHDIFHQLNRQKSRSSCCGLSGKRGA